MNYFRYSSQVSSNLSLFHVEAAPCTTPVYKNSPLISENSEKHGTEISWNVLWTWKLLECIGLLEHSYCAGWLGTGYCWSRKYHLFFELLWDLSLNLLTNLIAFYDNDENSHNNMYKYRLLETWYRNLSTCFIFWVQLRVWAKGLSANRQ